jgi:hypothetical protein
MKSFASLLLALAALVLPAASLASAPELVWNQERVTALAQDLSKHVDVLRAGLDGRASVPEEAAARAALTSDVERLQLRAKELAERLAKGASREQTTALFREVEQLEGQAAEHTHAFPARFEAHVDIDQVQRITIQLARYYGPSGAP